MMRSSNHTPRPLWIELMDNRMRQIQRGKEEEE